jgi:hypothetical protein
MLPETLNVCYDNLKEWNEDGAWNTERLFRSFKEKVSPMLPETLNVCSDAFKKWSQDAVLNTECLF